MRTIFECFWAEMVGETYSFDIGYRGGVVDGCDLPVGAVRSFYPSKSDIFPKEGYGPDSRPLEESDARYGPDGRHLAVETPFGVWLMDSKSLRGTYWDRTALPEILVPGQALDFSVYPSIVITLGEIKYHGWLRDGKLVEC